MTHKPRHRLSTRSGILIVSLLIGMSGLATAGSNTWTGGRPAGTLDLPAGLVAVDPSNPQVVYAAFGPDIYRSGDGGRSWTRTGFGSSSDAYVSALSSLVSPVSPSTLFAAGGREGDFGLFRSTDGGATWSTSLKVTTALVTALAASPSSLYAGTSAGAVQRSDDGGATWQSPSIPGLTARIATLLLDPGSDTTVYAAGGDNVDSFYYPPSLIFGKSTDRGATWSNLSSGLPSSAAAEALVLDPTDSSTLFVGLANSPSPLMIEHGVLRSSDGGSTWLPASGGLPALTSVFGLVADPQTSGTLYAATVSGLYRTRDAGTTWLPFSQQLAGLDVQSLVLGGGALHVAAPGGVFALELREGSVDVSAASGQTRLLSWNADRLSVRTLPASGDPVSTPEEGPFGAWTATAIADGADGLSRVLWVNGDGRVGLEIVGPNGAQAAFHFDAIPYWTAADVAVAADGTAHLLWTSSNGAMFISGVSASGAETRGPPYGPFEGWSALSIADGADGSTWVLWRSTDGRSGVSRHRDGVSLAAFRFEASPGWAAEDLTVGTDGRPRLLRVNPDGRAEVTTVDAQGGRTDTEVHVNAGFAPRRIAAGPDGLTRLLWGSTGGSDSVTLLNPDNTLHTQLSVPGGPGS